MVLTFNLINFRARLARLLPFWLGAFIRHMPRPSTIEAFAWRQLSVPLCGPSCPFPLTHLLLKSRRHIYDLLDMTKLPHYQQLSDSRTRERFLVMVHHGSIGESRAIRIF